MESLAINAIVPAAEDGKEEEEADDEEEDGVPGRAAQAGTACERAELPCWLWATMAENHAYVQLFRLALVCLASSACILSAAPHPPLWPPPAPRAVPIRWVLQKETRSLEVLHGQSDLASWCAGARCLVSHAWPGTWAGIVAVKPLGYLPTHPPSSVPAGD